MTRASLVTSRGVPREISRPWWNTTTRWVSDMITSMMCSTMTMVMPPSWMRRTSSIASCTSAGVRPAIASSSSSTVGSEASARAISSRLRHGVPRLLAGASASRASPTRSSTASALARASLALWWRSSAPIVTLSSTDIDSKVSGTWKERASPSRARVSGGRRVTSWPLKCTVPEVGGRSPVRQLKKVDLPAPLGPIRPSMLPCSTVTEASSTALKAPNALVMFRASISMAGHRLGLAAAALLDQRQQPARQEARQQHDDGAVDEEGEPRALAAEVGVRQLLERHQDQRADQWAEQLARAAERRHHHHLDRDQDAEARLRIDEAVDGEVERAGERGERRTQHVGVELVGARGDAERAGGALAVLDGAQVIAHAAALDAPGQPEQRHQHGEEDVVIRRGRHEGHVEHAARHRRPAQPLRAAQEIRGRGEHAHQLADRDGRHAEVMPGEAQRRHADEGRDAHAQHHADRRAEDR